MTTAAMLLAAAVLLGGRARAGLLRGVPPAARAGDEVRKSTRSDPFATASALDVFAVCLSAGMAVPAAAAATADFAPPALGAVLRRAADLLMMGADPDTAWQVPAGDPDEGCAALARLARRSASSGSALAAGVAELAEQSRQHATHSATAAAERAGVLIAGPLGLCFLPAFVCLGIVPVVAGLADEIFGAGLL
jgi:pilus assembly protein TadC